MPSAANLGETFNPKAKPATGYRQSGQAVTNPRALAAIAIKNARAASQTLAPSPLAQAIAKKRKKAY